MARLARLVVPGHPHHVTQRGNRRQDTFFGDDDYRSYLSLLAECCRKAGTEVWAYCLMPNHVHLVLVPSHEDGLRAALAETHRRYTRHVNLREDWRGHLWQERFHSFAMDEDHLLACARFVELNPVRARLAQRPGDWRWSSARAHLAGKDDGVVSVAPMLERALASAKPPAEPGPDWATFLDGGIGDEEIETFLAHERTGHPLGSDGFLETLARIVGRTVKPRKPGRPRKTPGDT